MFLKCDGERVWLRSNHRLPYLAIKGEVSSREDPDIIRGRLRAHYEHVSSIADGGAFLIDRLEPSGEILFCLTSTKECAFLLLAENCEGGVVSSPIELLSDRVKQAIKDVALRGKCAVELRSLRCETSFVIN